MIRAQQAVLQNHQAVARILQLLWTMSESCADFPCGAEDERDFPLTASFFLVQIAVATPGAGTSILNPHKLMPDLSNKVPAEGTHRKHPEP